MSDDNDQGDPHDPLRTEYLTNLVEQLLGSVLALQAVGRELGPIIASAILGSPNTHTISTHNTPLLTPGMSPYSASYAHSGNQLATLLTAHMAGHSTVLETSFSMVLVTGFSMAHEILTGTQPISGCTMRKAAVADWTSLVCQQCWQVSWAAARGT